MFLSCKVTSAAVTFVASVAIDLCIPALTTKGSVKLVFWFLLLFCACLVSFLSFMTVTYSSSLRLCFIYQLKVILWGICNNTAFPSSHISPMQRTVPHQLTSQKQYKRMLKKKQQHLVSPSSRKKEQWSSTGVIFLLKLISFMSLGD